MNAQQTAEPEVTYDEDGFLQTISEWSPEVAKVLAEKNEIGPLDERHWRVIEFVKQYYRDFGVGPPVLKICRATGLTRQEVCALFPCGVVRGAYRLAGLPRPAGCF